MNKDNNCMYCTMDNRVTDLMIEVCELSVSTLFLFKEQTHKGRCIVAYKDHVKELFELDEKELELYTKDLAKAAAAISKAFSPNKINYATYGDSVPHIHFHLVPKYVGGASWGQAFEMSPKDKVFLSDEEYKDMINLIKGYL
jgi:ATP adenylyltransferase